ncbi:PAS domain-containing protein [Paraburkholderia acidicola]|uniref:PAS domain-containing protein n=1 Tax=Paraburkholderia acidicola TaxID=1912599 RepID=A0ABV1LUK5_9BURK
MKSYYMTTLGGFALRAPSGEPVPVPTRKQMALLAYLAVHPGRVMHRATLVTMLWGADEEDRARHSLSQALYGLKRLLSGDAICAQGQMVWLADGCIQVDALEMTRLADDRSVHATATVERLYQGDFLAGLQTGEEPFDHWRLSEQERLRRIAYCSIDTLISSGALGLRDHDALLRVSQSLLRVDPFDEQAHCRVMEIYASQGVRNMAIAHFQKLAADLERELDLQPSERLVEAYEAICNNTERVRPMHYRLEDYAFVVEQIPQAVVVTDLENRIVGWNRASERVFGFSKSEMIGRSPTMLYAPNGDSRLADDILGKALESGSWSADVTLKTKSGHSCRQRRIVAPLYSPEGRCIGAFGQGLAG